MNKEFKEIKPIELKDNVFKLIGSDWMLITAGDIESFNTMTASWGGLGHLWEKYVCFIFVRPQRYTYEFMEKNELFSLSFFSEKHRPALQLCGTKSGRDIDKMAESGLTACQTWSGAVAFDQARLVLECRKLYYQDINPDTFVDSTLDKQVYPQHDYHRMYIGQILRVMRR